MNNLGCISIKGSSSCIPDSVNRELLKMIGFLTIAFLVISANVSAILTSTRIINGDPLPTAGAVPSMVSVQLNSRHFCGGDIISEKYVLTGAVCVMSGSKDQYSIRAGTLLHNSGGSIHQVRKIIIHEDFHITSHNIPINDIALVHVGPDFILDGIRDIISLVSQPTTANSYARIGGWGWTNSTFPDNLRISNLKIVDKESCNEVFEGLIPSGQICALAIETDSCKGDGGGPLVVGIHLAGIISWGRGCGNPEYPGIYTDIYTYKSWIENNIKL